MRLRIISGIYGSRRIDTPDGFTTHPMGERIRGALFNSLGDITGKTVLDPFAGSGAISLEAISRGAAHATAIERDRGAQRIIAKNITTLGAQDTVTLIKANCHSWSQHNPDAAFDLILCDPPYHDLQLSTVSLLTRHLKPNGLMLLSYPGSGSAPPVSGVVVVNKFLSFGDAALARYRLEV